MGSNVTTCYSKKIQLVEVTVDGKLNRYCIMIDGKQAQVSLIHHNLGKQYLNKQRNEAKKQYYNMIDDTPAFV